MTHRFVRPVRAILANRVGAPPFDPRAFWQDQPRRDAQARMLVRVFYFVQFGLLIDQYHQWEWWLTRTSDAPLWPIAWSRLTGMRTAVTVIVALSVIGSLAAALRPDLRLARLLAALGMLEFSAFYNSFGGITHGWHAFLFICVALMFLPTPRRHPDSPAPLGERQRFLRGVWYAQFAVLMTYTSSGFFKFAMACFQFAKGEHSAFGFEGLARHIATRLFEGAPRGPQFMSNWVLDYPPLGWPLLLSSIYFELFSLLVAFRPSLHRTWGVMLVLMHVGIYFLTTIMFSWHLIAVGLLLICSPFERRTDLPAAIRDLPLFGDALTLIARLKPKAARPDVSTPGLAIP